MTRFERKCDLAMALQTGLVGNQAMVSDLKRSAGPIEYGPGLGSRINAKLRGDCWLGKKA